MVTTDRDAVQKAADRLQVLADALRQRGFKTRLLMTGDKLRLWVQHPAIFRMSDAVYAAPAEDGSWWLWWSWEDQIARIDDVEDAAVKIAYVLTPA